MTGVYYCYLLKNCVAKWEWKTSVFSLKSVTNLFSWNKGRIRGIFLLFKRLSRDQYALQFLLTLVIFLSSVHNSIVLNYLLRSLTVPEDGLAYWVMGHWCYSFGSLCKVYFIMQKRFNPRVKPWRIFVIIS